MSSLKGRERDKGVAKVNSLQSNLLQLPTLLLLLLAQPPLSLSLNNNPSSSSSNNPSDLFSHSGINDSSCILQPFQAYVPPGAQDGGDGFFVVVRDLGCDSSVEEWGGVREEEGFELTREEGGGFVLRWRWGEGGRGARVGG